MKQLHAIFVGFLTILAVFNESQVIFIRFQLIFNRILFNSTSIDLKWNFHSFSIHFKWNSNSISIDFKWNLIRFQLILNGI